MASFVWDQAKMGGSPNQTSFQANMYSNPQMGAFGKSGSGVNQYFGGPYGGQSGGQSGGGTWAQRGGQQLITDPNTGLLMYVGGVGGGQQAQGYSPTMADYYQSFSGPGDMWSGGIPGHYGQDYTFDPVTGQSGYESHQNYLGTPGGSSMFLSGIDPKTGNQYTNVQGLMGQFDGMFGGGGGYDPYQMTDFQGGQITAPGAYGGGDWDVAKNVVNVHDVIESYRPTMEAEIGAGFAQAGNRLGQSGFAMSTPYATALGDVERLARAQMNQRGLEYQYDAGKFDAGNQMAVMMAENAEKYGAWNQQGNWDMQAQQGNVSNATQQWMLENQLGYQGNQAQNQYNQQGQMNQQQFLASLLGGLI